MIGALNAYFRERFGFCAEKSRLEAHTADEWAVFAGKHCPGAAGVYLARDTSAHINIETWPIAVFHEYFGHGLYIEHSLHGKELYSLEQRLLKEEEDAGISTEEERNAFWLQSNTCRQIEEFEKRNIAAYEGFALWMEWYLSMLTGNMPGYEQRFNGMPEYKKQICRKLVRFSQANTDYALLYASGFPKYYNSSILNEIVRNVFKEDIHSIEFALAYGSGRPYSDIDLFIVSDAVPSFFAGWLDVYSVSRGAFNYLLSKLDISITDALFSGEFVYGDNAAFQNARKKALNKKITKKAIDFHIKHSEKAKALSGKCEDARGKRSAARHAVSYALNALEMKNGNKPLTLKALMARYPAEFSVFEKSICAE